MPPVGDTPLSTIEDDVANSHKSACNGRIGLGPNRLLIDGQWVGALSGRTIEVQCPANKLRIADTACADASDVDLAVAAAARAFDTWRRLSATERGTMLMRIADALAQRLEEVAQLLAHETGNALRTQSRPEVQFAISTFRYYGGLAGELKGMNIPLGDGVLSYTCREPLGVVGAIVPWNCPVSIATMKMAPALCAGNTVVLKAPEDAPLSLLMLADVCNQILPRGALNVLSGLGSECGAALAQHGGLQKISFTGSTAVGRSVLAASAERIIPVSLELGGKSPTIVYEDACEDWAVDGVISAMRFSRQSQSCTAGSRLFLHADLFDRFVLKTAAIPFPQAPEAG
jgi:betaine-aldehyde dehydrogenase